MPAAPLQTIRILPHISRALDAGAPIVALESSVLAQGLPVPQNGEAAQRMVAAIERVGAIAAITAVVCGTPALGLEPQELTRFLRRDGVRKVSARDIAVAVAQRADGATTVAGALAIAAVAGIRVFATGGIGGVHRQPPGASRPTVRDESADLMEMSRAPIIVVCAGAKAILDLHDTWERLETLGIPVIGYRTRELPGFYTAETGIPLDASVDDVSQVAAIARAHFGLERKQSVLVVQPPPANVALDADVIEAAVQRALGRAESDGIRGAAVTPYLLEAVARETAGRSLETNLALLEANAGLAGQIAVAMQASDR